MSSPKRTGHNPEYELAPDGKPAVGFSKGKDGYYFLIYLSHFLQSIPEEKTSIYLGSIPVADLQVQENDGLTMIFALLAPVLVLWCQEQCFHS